MATDETTVRTHTALHVLKGAVQQVLKAEWTAGVWVQGDHGRLVVQFDRAPIEEELNEIERVANRVIAEARPVHSVDMERSEAEAKYSRKIYDLFPVPAHIARFQLVEIPDWNLNCCAQAHTPSTQEVGRLRLVKARFRPGRQRVEFSFRVE